MRMSTANSKPYKFSLQFFFKIPTLKGEHSCKYTESSLILKEEIVEQEVWGALSKTLCILFGTFCIRNDLIYKYLHDNLCFI